MPDFEPPPPGFYIGPNHWWGWIRDGIKYRYRWLGFDMAIIDLLIVMRVCPKFLSNYYCDHL